MSYPPNAPRPDGNSTDFGTLLIPVLAVGILWALAAVSQGALVMVLVIAVPILIWLMIVQSVRHQRLTVEVEDLKREIARLNRAGVPGQAPAPPVVAPQPQPQPPPQPQPQPAAPKPKPIVVPPVMPELPVTPRPSQPSAPPAPSYDWDAAWRSLAGPLASVGRPDNVGTAEARIGIVWFSRVGMLLILISAIIGYVMLDYTWLQAGIGWLAGLGLVGLSRWGFARGYRPWAQAVSGGGLGILYLVTTSAATVFDPPVISVAVAFGLMVLVTVLGTYLSVVYDSMVVGLLAMVGGFATPFLLSTGQGSFQVLFTYMLILDLGLLGVAWFKRWHLYNYVLFAATWIIYGGWRAAAYTPADAGWAFLFTTLFFTVFAGVAVLYNMVHQDKSRYQDVGMALINGFVYFGSGLELLPAGAWRALFAFGMAAGQLLLGLLSLRRNRQDRLLQLSFLGLAGIFLTIAFPVALSGPWISVAWALEAAALTWIGFLTGERWTRSAGLGVFGLATAGLLGWEMFVLTGEGFMLRSFTFLAVIAAFYLGVWAYSRFSGDTRIKTGLAAAASFLTLWYITFEITVIFGPGQAAQERLAIAGAWALYGLAVALAEMRFPLEGVRTGARLIMGAALAYLVAGSMLVNAAQAGPWYRYAAYVAVLGSIWTAEYRFRRPGLRDPLAGALTLVGLMVGFFVGAFEVALWLRPGMNLAGLLYDRAYWTATAALWGAYSLAVMLVGIQLRSARMRMMAGVDSLLAQAAILLQGLRLLDADPLIRVLAFLTIIPGTYLSVWKAGSAADRSEFEVRFHRGIALGAAGLTALWGALELLGELHRRVAFHGVLLWLGLYGLAVLAAGLWLRVFEARVMGVAITALALIGSPLAALTSPGSLLAWLSLVGAVGSAYAMAWLVRRQEAITDQSEHELTGQVAVGAAAVTFLWVTIQLANLLDPPETVAAVLIWAGLYGFAVLEAGLRLDSRAARVLGWLIAAGGALIGTAQSGLDVASVLRAATFAASIGSVYLATWAVSLRRGRIPAVETDLAQWASLGAAVLTVGWIYSSIVRLGVPGATLQDFLLSAAFAGYGFLVLAAGFLLRHRNTRLLAIGLVGLVILKVLVRDMWNLELVWRVWIGAGIGTMLVVASLAYQRFVRIIVGEDDSE